jgi:hypothetical protein
MNDSIWLHAWRYSCEHPSRAFSVQAPLPEWVSPFAPLLGVEEALEMLTAAASAHVHDAEGGGGLEPDVAVEAASQPERSDESEEAKVKRLKAEESASAASASSALL